MNPERTITGGTYRLVDIVDSSNIIRNLIATDVTFYGPAVMIIGSQGIDSSNLFENAVWHYGEGGIEALIWDIDPIRERIIGAIGLADCEFIRCTFIDIGVAGQHDEVTTMLNTLHHL